MSIRRTILWLATALAYFPLTGATLELGANFNENLHAARVPSLDATGVKWIRGFLPASPFLNGSRKLATDPGLAVFKTAAASGRKVALTLKWDFLLAKTAVPSPDSAEEKACFAWAIDVSRQCHPDMLLLVNEVSIDTPEAGLKPDKQGNIPMVVFLQRLAAYVHAAKLTTPDGKPLLVSCGGFTRLDQTEIQQSPATKALLSWLATTPDITHVNFHLHEPTLKEFAEALAFVRGALPGRPFVVTEFSLVWAFRQHIDDPIGQTEAGRAFAAKFNHDPAQTVRAYFDAAALQPITETELHAMLASQPWFDPQSLEKECELMEKNGVVLATYAYLQESSGMERPKSRIGSVPWRLNPVFQERHAFVPNSNRLATNLGLYDTFVRRQK
jgi:hypothetical protein